MKIMHSFHSARLGFPWWHGIFFVRIGARFILRRFTGFYWTVVAESTWVVNGDRVEVVCRLRHPLLPFQVHYFWVQEAADASNRRGHKNPKQRHKNRIEPKTKQRRETLRKPGVKERKRKNVFFFHYKKNSLGQRKQNIAAVINPFPSSAAIPKRICIVFIGNSISAFPVSINLVVAGHRSMMKLK